MTRSRLYYIRCLLLLAFVFVTSFYLFDDQLGYRTKIQAVKGAYATWSTAGQNQDQEFDVRREWITNGTDGRPPWMLLVHIGKTGGSSLRKSLNLNMKRVREKTTCLVRHTQELGQGMKKSMNECSSLDEGEQYQMRNHIVSMMHLYHKTQFIASEKEWILSHANSFLITTRLPVSRVASNFNFRYHGNFGYEPPNRKEHPANVLYVQFYLDCFATFNDLVQAVQIHDANIRQQNETSGAQSTKAQRCRDLGRLVLQGNKAIDGLQHFDKGFHHYAQASMDQRPHVPVVVVRTEHLSYDAKNLAEAMGDYDTVFDNHRNKGKRNVTKPDAQTISKMDMTGLCCQIIRDLDAYQRILLAARNLNSTEKQESIQGSLDECGINRHTTDIPIPIPFDWTSWYRHKCQFTGPFSKKK